MSALVILGFAALLVAVGYGALALVVALLRRPRSRQSGTHPLPPVSVLKPLCGSEPGLYENLRSFCQQDYPEYQVVFGVVDGRDPALAVVERLTAEFPTLSIDVVIDPRQHGSNRKTSNLINILAATRHDVLVMADSDVRVDAGYLRTVTAPLQDETVGLVTCLYRAVPTNSIFSRLGAMYINEWYMPSVLIARLFGYQGYVSGSTICLRRDTLRSFGGLQAVANHLADDHELGERVRGLGHRIVLSTFVPGTECHEPTLGSLILHEARWMRTLYALRPRSFLFLFCSFSLPMAFGGATLTIGDRTFAPLAWALFGIAIAARLALHLLDRLREDRPALADLWLVPIRDLLLCCVWGRGLFASRIFWRDIEFSVDGRGVLHRPS